MSRYYIFTFNDNIFTYSVHILAKHYMFKPVSIQSLWTTIQSLHAISAKLKPKRNSICVLEVDWVSDYQDAINSPQSCVNEWNEMPDILVSWIV